MLDGTDAFLVSDPFVHVWHNQEGIHPWHTASNQALIASRAHLFYPETD